LKDGTKTRYKLPKKWWFLLGVDFKISDRCCYELKKAPVKKYEKENHVVTIMGTKVKDGIKRKMKYYKTGCNSFEGRRPMSKPLSIWTDQDILRSIKENNLPIAKCYGDIIEDEAGKLKTTGLSGTGCMFCMFAVHMEQCPNRFQQMKINHPKQ